MTTPSVRGWDGLIEAGAATPWVPEGKSCWEFSVNQNPSSKAESDYTARIRSVSPAERRECTFVFVTPRNWPGKTEWARNKHVAGDWKAVRVFDASDLEQWLEGVDRWADLACGETEHRRGRT